MSRVEDLKETAPCGMEIHYTVDNDTDFISYSDINGRGIRCEACHGCTWYGICQPQDAKKSGYTVYISGAISGTVNYMSRFAEAEKKLREMGYTVINPARINAQLPPETTYEQYMSMSLFLMDMCDTIYQLKGWENSKGANREYGYALAKDFIILKEAHFDEKKSVQS